MSDPTASIDCEPLVAAAAELNRALVAAGDPRGATASIEPAQLYCGSFELLPWTTDAIVAGAEAVWNLVSQLMLATDAAFAAAVDAAAADVPIGAG